MANVPRGTIEKLADNPEDLIAKLEIYEREIERWNPKINLISPQTMPDIWQRHFVDSLQLKKFVPRGTKTAMDIGSGGGFPALVLAAACPDISWTLVESDQRKGVFLRKASRAMKLKVNVVSERIEKVKIPSPHIITARALADLNKLLEWVELFAQENTTLIFPKGKSWESELTCALKNWQMDVKIIPSETDSNAKIICITHLKRAK